MAKKPSAATAKQPSAALTLLKTILAGLAEAIANDEAVARLAEEEFGIILSDAEREHEDEDDDFDEEEEEPSPRKKVGKSAPAKKPAAKAPAKRVKKAPSVEELADAVSEGDLSVLDTVDDDVLLAVAKALKAPRAMLKNVDEAIGWLEENFGAEEDEGQDGFDVDSADEEELMAFALENKIGTRSRLSKLDEDELRTTVADWLEEQEGEGEDEDEDEEVEDGFDDEDFDDEDEDEFEDEDEI